ncbi:MAG: cadmium-translocating P-type ATPase [Peptococcaceae bacterium]|nr:cadmium-translocating P-type ATPase [Peptococcaceae bacterium]
MDKLIIPIGGMSCAACAGGIEARIKKLAGVASVTVNFAAEKAVVTYDPQRIRLSDIRKTIEDAGYKVLMDHIDEQSEKIIRTLWIKFIIAAVFALPLLFVAMAPMIGGWFPGAELLHTLMTNQPLGYALLELLLVLPIIGMGYRFFTIGFGALIRRSPNMDSLIALGSTAALLFSLYNIGLIFRGHTEAVESLYFETAGMIMTLIMLGKALEAVTKGRTGEAIKKLMKLAPTTAILWQDDQEREIPVDQVNPGDVIIVKPGGKIPVDGILLTGYPAINESMLTGESMPTSKQPGDPVYTATLNTTGTFQFQAEKTGADTVLAQIVRLVEDAQSSKAPIARLADIISGYFVPVVCGIAILAGMAWFVATRDVTFALTVFISVLVIACPCALGLATPAAIMAGTGQGAQKGILFKNGEVLETAHKINTVIFDKTGTLTVGCPVVTDIMSFAENGVSNNESRIADIVCFAASAEVGSEHPLGQAIVAEARKRDLVLAKADNFQTLTGRGIEAVVEGQTVLIGSRELMEKSGISLGERQNQADILATAGKTPMFVAVDGNLAGLIAVADVVKSTAGNAVTLLKTMGIETAMITGDNAKTAAAIAEQVGIDRVLSEVLPKDKAGEIKNLQENGRRTAMVGDGINDAPALVQADIGMAIGSGTDVAIESAGIVLMRGDPMDVPAAINLSKKTMRVIKQNLFWAFGYNVVGIPIAAGLLYLFGGPLLNPIIAAAAMSLSSVSVLTNALIQLTINK